MQLNRYIKESNIDLAFDPYAGVVLPPDEEDLDPEDMTPRQRYRRKEIVLAGLVKLLEPSGRITNPKKCLTDLRNREAKASTAFGNGIAMPHVRTAQAKDFVLGVAIAPEPGLWFDALDGEPVRIFFPMVAPAYNDRFYRRVEKALALAFLEDGDDFGEGGLKQQLLDAADPGEVIYLLREHLA